MRMKHTNFYFISIALIIIPLSVFADQASRSGDSHYGSEGVTESVAQIMQRPFDETIARKQMAKPLHIIHREGLPQHPESFAVEARFANQQRAYPSQKTRATSTVQTVALNFLGAQYSESGFVPPDADGAVGPQQYFLVASGIVKTFNKINGALDGVINTSLDNFFASVLPSGSYVGDIRVFYDTQAQRFFVLGRSSNTSGERIMIAVSQSSVISQSSYFTFFYINTATFTTGLELDYPTLGSDSNVFIPARIFLIAMAIL